MPNQTVILCIDDNQAGLAVRQLLLESKGFVVRTATNGWSGLEIARNETVHAVVLDYKMPEMDGEEVAKHLRALHPHIPILLLSGFPGLVPESMLAIVDGFVEKGQPAALLIEEIERLTKASRNLEVEERQRA